jgi:predicted nucleic acid-binding Zn ribbon protein
MINTYNYWCLNVECNENTLLHISTTEKNKDKTKCPKCKGKLKLVGLHSNILHHGTQESR